MKLRTLKSCSSHANRELNSREKYKAEPVRAVAAVEPSPSLEEQQPAIAFDLELLAATIKKE